MPFINRLREEENEDVNYSKPGTLRGECCSVFVANVPCLKETGEASEGYNIGCDCIRHVRANVIHNGGG